MKTLKALLSIFIGASCLVANAQQNLDAYITSPDSNKFVVVASSANSLSSPVDLDFYPDQTTRPNELWILME